MKETLENFIIHHAVVLPKISKFFERISNCPPPKLLFEMGLVNHYGKLHIASKTLTLRPPKSKLPALYFEMISTESGSRFYLLKDRTRVLVSEWSTDEFKRHDALSKRIAEDVEAFEIENETVLKGLNYASRVLENQLLLFDEIIENPPKEIPL